MLFCNVHVFTYACARAEAPRPEWRLTRTSNSRSLLLDQKSEELQKPQPLLSKKVLQYTSNLYGSTPPVCNAVPSWLPSFEEREAQQYTSHLYGSMPPICTAVLLRKYWGLGSPLPKKRPKFITSHDVLEPLKQAFLASHDVIPSSQVCSSNAKKVFHIR